MKAKSYLDKRTELLPGMRASLFVTDGWRGGEEEGGALRKWLIFACSYAVREIECCSCVYRMQAYRPHSKNIRLYSDGHVCFSLF